MIKALGEETAPGKSPSDIHQYYIKLSRVLSAVRITYVQVKVLFEKEGREECVRERGGGL